MIRKAEYECKLSMLTRFGAMSNIMRQAKFFSLKMPCAGVLLSEIHG
jgi:hypothetical protein